MTFAGPGTAAPERAAGASLGEAWIVAMPPTDGSRQVVALSTGVHSLTIVRVPDPRWDRGPGPGTVHVHNDHDETIVLPTGSGWLIHGPDLAHLRLSRFRGPVVLALPAGIWHHVVMDPRASATGTCLFTAPDAIVARSGDREPDTVARVSVAGLPVAPAGPAVAGSWSGALTMVDQTGRIDPDEPADGHGEGAARLIHYEQPEDGRVDVLDSGGDSVSVTISRTGPPAPNPETVEVRSRHATDAFVVLEGGAGYLVTGGDVTTLVRTPFEGPAVLVLPAGGAHAIVRTDDQRVDSIEVHTDRRAVVPRYEQILERTLAADVAGGALEGADR